jgi:hypothetical protein
MIPGKDLPDVCLFGYIDTLHNLLFLSYWQSIVDNTVTTLWTSGISELYIRNTLIVVQTAVQFVLWRVLLLVLVCRQYFAAQTVIRSK